ncbi:sugar permease [Halobacillus mangrovi]|uniref:Sugar permease n=2 Tax=Halobacillus mangrovi TaxID=402384 RepID=A0A1W6A0H4_9BACI|nr:sugar permease [Halobacillus mangrovi]
MIYRIEGDTYTVEDVDGNEHTLTSSNQFTINGVFKKISFLDENKEINLDRDGLQDLRDHLTTKKTFFGQKVIDNLYQPLGKSFIVATVTTIVAIFICAPAAYVISRLPSYIGYIVVLSLLVTRMFPDVGIALPVATRFLSWGMTDTSFGLILAHLIPNLPFLAWILVGTFATIPKDLEQSAMIDGANRITALARVVFPIAIPGIAVGSIFVWLNSWNEFIYARYLSTEVATLPLRIFEVITRGSIFPAAACSMILTIPVIIITFVLQRYMKSGMLSGAVKG